MTLDRAERDFVAGHRAQLGPNSHAMSDAETRAFIFAHRREQCAACNPHVQVESTGDSDLDCAIENNSILLSGQIVAVLSVITGARDEADWHWMVQLSGDRYAYLSGCCDYTGWDCQSHLDAFEAGTILDAFRLVPEDVHDELLMNYEGQLA